MNPPVIDLHCDLLAHLLNTPNPDPFIREGIGCSFPALAEGNVKQSLTKADQSIPSYGRSRRIAKRLPVSRTLYPIGAI